VKPAARSGTCIGRRCLQGSGSETWAGMFMRQAHSMPRHRRVLLESKPSHHHHLHLITPTTHLLRRWHIAHYTRQTVICERHNAIVEDLNRTEWSTCGRVLEEAANPQSVKLTLCDLSLSTVPGCLVTTPTVQVAYVTVLPADPIGALILFPTGKSAKTRSDMRANCIINKAFLIPLFCEPVSI
jgi:hypothetical protein